MRSIITNNMECCYLCGSTHNIEVHHILFGTAMRKIADKLGLKVPLCAEHHRGMQSPHRDRAVDLMLKQTAQKAYEAKHSREDWMRKVGRNYL